MQVHRPDKSRRGGVGALQAMILGALVGGTAPLGADLGGLDSAASERPDGRAEWRRPAVRAPLDAAPGSTRLSRAPTTVVRARANAAPGPKPALLPTPGLGSIPPQTLVAGRPWQLRLRGRADGGESPRMDARRLPPGARLKALGDGGWHVLDWTPPPEAIGKREITLVAIDRHEPSRTTERVLRLEIRAASPSRSNPARTAPRRPDAVSEPFSEPPAAPTIETLPAQIVNAGRVVRLQVRARLDDGRPPRLKIDRLPTRASFDENRDGSRTLYWPTDDGDQGEHRFRITALHPDDGTRASHVEALVIVGDSNRSSSQPDLPLAVPVLPEPPPPGDYFADNTPEYPSPTDGMFSEFRPDEPHGDYFDGEALDSRAGGWNGR